MGVVTNVAVIISVLSAFPWVRKYVFSPSPLVEDPANMKQ
jgi:hypothetical protein